MSCHHVTNISLSAQKLPSCLFAAIASPTPAPGTTYLLSDNIFPRISCKCLHVSVHAIYILSLYLASFAQHGRLRCIHTFGCINNNFLFVAARHSWHGHTWNLLIDLIKLNLISSISTYIQLLALEEAILNANGLASFSPASL